MELTYTFERTFTKIDQKKGELQKGEYEACTFQGSDLSGADLSGYRFLDTEFLDCDLSNAELVGTFWQKVTFRNCKMLGLRFDVSHELGFAVTFEGCQLDHSSFYQRKLSRSVFIDSRLHGVDLAEADMKGSKVKDCDLLNAIFENTGLENADLRGSVNYSIDPEINRVKGAAFSWPGLVGLLDKYNIKVDSDA